MRILVTGARGQLGSEVMKALQQTSHEAFGIGREEADITNEAAVTAIFEQIRPEAVIHCAGYTAVDAAEDNQELCYRVNVAGTEILAGACKKYGSRLLYISTDYVFDGHGAAEWQPEDEGCPLNYYGWTRYEGEQRVKAALEQYFIVRISWLYGVNGTNFVKTMLRLSETKPEISVVCDQIGSPTYAKDLAELLAAMVQTERYGCYHATNEGFCSWYEFACEIMKQAGRATRVKPIPGSEYTSRAKRPLNSRLSKEKLTQAGFTRLPDWQDALGRFLSELSK